MPRLTITFDEKQAAEMERLRLHQPFPPSTSQLIRDAVAAFLVAPGYPYEPLPREGRKKKGARK